MGCCWTRGRNAFLQRRMRPFNRHAVFSSRLRMALQMDLVFYASMIEESLDAPEQGAQAHLTL